ncbi:MAG: DUF3352 domain-containing protein [Candidatus Peregrinibacteria bacterium]
MVNKPLLLKTLRNLHHKKEDTSSKFLLGILSVGAILLVFLVVYLIGSAYLSRTVASMLPAKITALYLEIADTELPPKLRDSAWSQIMNLQPLLQLWGVDPALIPSWAKKNVGVAVVKNKPVFFFRSASRRQALKFLKSMELNGEELGNRGTAQFPIYIYPQGQQFAFAFSGPYLFISTDVEVLKSIHAVFQGQEVALDKETGFVSLSANLPQTTWLQGYLDLQSFGTPKLDALINPLRQFSSQLGFTVRQTQEGFHFNSFLALNREVISLDPLPPRDPVRMTGLSEKIPAESLISYLGGADLASSWQNTLASMEKLNPAYGILLEGMLRAQVNRIFGNNVSLADDLYPLFTGEYALTFSSLDDGKLGIGLTLTHGDMEGARKKLKKLSEGFSLLAAQFTPQLLEVTLPDDTVSRELVADPDSLSLSHETYQGIDMDCVEVQASIYGFCYAVTDELMILANHASLLKASIDALSSPDLSLAQSQAFRQGLSALSQVNEEVSFVNLQSLAPLLQKTPWGQLLLPYLSPLDSTTWVKHTFEDGMSTEGFVLIK